VKVVNPPAHSGRVCSEFSVSHGVSVKMMLGGAQQLSDPLSELLPACWLPNCTTSDPPGCGSCTQRTDHSEASTPSCPSGGAHPAAPNTRPPARGKPTPARSGRAGRIPARSLRPIGRRDVTRGPNAVGRGCSCQTSDAHRHSVPTDGNTDWRLSRCRTTSHLRFKRSQNDHTFAQSPMDRDVYMPLPAREFGLGDSRVPQ
jgi:hypothetical protein